MELDGCMQIHCVGQQGFIIDECPTDHQPVAVIVVAKFANETPGPGREPRGVDVADVCADDIFLSTWRFTFVRGKRRSAEQNRND